jgi:hypothetical protein
VSSGDEYRRRHSDRTPQRRDRSGPRASPEPTDGRGQTTLDFAVGVSVLLLTLATVFLFVPGALGVFTEGGQENIGSANRIATSLSEGQLGDPTRPHVLNTTCTVEFFADSSPAHCRHSGGTLSERVGLNRFLSANVTMQSNLSSDSDGSDVLCRDSDNSTFVERDVSACDPGEVELRIGPSPPSGSATTVTARRIVDVDDTDATMLVVVW